MRRMTEPAATVGRARWAFRTAFGSSLMLGVLVSCSDPAVAPFSDPGAEPQAHPALPRATVARVEDFDAAVPQAYYALSLEFSKRTAGFTPPVQARAYAYMGLALYESLVGGMIPAAVVRTEAGRTRRARTIDLVPTPLEGANGAAVDCTRAALEVAASLLGVGDTEPARRRALRIRPRDELPQVVVDRRLLRGHQPEHR